MRVKGAISPVSGRCLHVSTMFKIFLTIISVFISPYIFSQSNYQVLSKIDNIVQQTDSLSNKSQRTFYLNKIDKKYNGVKETWHYTMRDGKVVVFQIRYVLDSTEFTEIYYINKGDLIYSEEYETMYYTVTGDDEIKWGGIYYFVGNNLKQRVTLGNKKSKYFQWNPESETLSRFERRFSELQQNIPLTSKN
jgi:lipopolysaccharide export LptBFGC system permease protein LptF